MVSLSFLAPIVLLIAALVSLLQSGRRPGAYPRWSEAAALIAFALTGVGVLQTIARGGEAVATGLLRADAVSATMALLVGFIGWIVLRYSRTYLDGEAREGRFHGLMLATLAAVLIFVQSASLPLMIAATVAVGLILRRLLLFYPDRPEAWRAARKFSRVWHAGDVALIAAALVLAASHDTLSLIELNTSPALDAGTWEANIAIGLLILAAALKTAAFPVHGWLTEVMEAPTPVSALLHAGVINSGGVLLISLAGLVQQSPGALAVLVLMGGFTSLFGAAVMLTQSAVKTALAWSTVSQMGFMLLQCGLGLWALALLHIVAHSLYKAHAFLASGGAVRAVADIRRPGPVAAPNLSAVVKSFGLALLLYAVIALVFMAIFGAKSPQALALGGILIFGVAYLVAQGLADLAPEALTKRTIGASAAAAFLYFAFQVVAQAIWGQALPPVPAPGPLDWGLIVLAVASFGGVAFAQALFPHWAHHPAMAGLRVHLVNGLYLNALLDRAIGGFRTRRAR